MPTRACSRRRGRCCRPTPNPRPSSPTSTGCRTPRTENRPRRRSRRPAAKMKAALPALQKVVETTKSATTRFEIARALAQLGDASVAPTVAPLLGDQDGAVRMAAADCVGVLKLTALGPKVVPLLNDAE